MVKLKICLTPELNGTAEKPRFGETNTFNADDLPNRHIVVRNAKRRAQ